MARSPDFEGPATFAEHVAACFDVARDVWGIAIDLSPPSEWKRGTENHWGGQEPLAYIDLNTRQIVVNFDRLDRISALGSLTAVLAHEVGHHVRHPHTLGLSAGLDVLQRRILPAFRDSLTNLFFDLLVNEHVGHDHAAELCDVYRGFVAAESANLSPMFSFYLAVYEELWGLAPGDLAGESNDRALEQQFPGARDEARMFAQTLYALPDVWVQFVYFGAVFRRYLPASGVVDPFPISRDAALPSADDYADALRGNAAAERALNEAKKRGWHAADDDPGDARPRVSGKLDPMAVIQQVGGSRPGTEVKAFHEALVSRLYRDLVDEHLIAVPTLPDTRVPDLVIPSTTEDWDWGDSPSTIDWTASLVEHGGLAAAMPRKRVLLPDDPDDRGIAVPPFEVYLDTSGSMPSPMVAVNAMTLAAQVLAAAAIRKGAPVRGIVYSAGPFLASDWMLDESFARRFLLNYSGGGTDFPFDELVASADRRPDAIRVIVSDGDFLSNVSHRGAINKLIAGTRASHRVIAMLAYSTENNARQILAKAVAEPKFRLVVVGNYADLGRAAGDLARALYE